MELELKKWINPDKAPADESYLVRALSGLEMQPYLSHARARILAGVAPADVEITPEIAEDILVLGIVDWKGILAGGAAVECSDEYKIKLPTHRVSWLISEIVSLSLMTPDLEKNLSSRAKSQRTRKNSTAARARGGNTATK